MTARRPVAKARQEKYLRAIDLKVAVVQMVLRLESTAGAAVNAGHCGDWDLHDRLIRRRRWQFAALRRLVDALKECAR